MDDPNIKVVTYEDLKQVEWGRDVTWRRSEEGSIKKIHFYLLLVSQDLTTSVRDISSFFGFSLTEDQVKQISEGSTFRAMKEKSMETHATMGTVIFRKGDITGFIRVLLEPDKTRDVPSKLVAVSQICQELLRSDVFPY